MKETDCEVNFISRKIEIKLAVAREVGPGANQDKQESWEWMGARTALCGLKPLQQRGHAIAQNYGGRITVTGQNYGDSALN